MSANMNEEEARPRRAQTCPLCGTAMEQCDIEHPVWTLAELAADLARIDGEDALLWYSRCPRGCTQCFGCRAWLAPGEQCKDCPACPNCGGAMVLLSEEDESEDGEEDNDPAAVHFECMRCGEEPAPH